MSVRDKLNREQLGYYDTIGVASLKEMRVFPSYIFENIFWKHVQKDKTSRFSKAQWFDLFKTFVWTVRKTIKLGYKRGANEQVVRRELQKAIVSGRGLQGEIR